MRSVANLTRADGEDFFALSRANEAIAALRKGEVAGAAVLVP